MFAISLLALIFQLRVQEEKPLVPLLSFEHSIKVGDTQISVAKAETEVERIRGLSGQRGLYDDQGLIFVFDKLGNHTIWMKDMRFAIDIFWFDENYNLIHIEENVSPNSFPETFSAGSPSLFVLETKSGFTKQTGIKIGDKLETLSF